MKRLLSLLAATLLSFPVAGAQNYAAQSGAGMAGKKAKLLSGYVAQENVRNLTSQIHWYTSLSQAEAAAQRQGKMIVWIHMLGQLDGAT